MPLTETDRGEILQLGGRYAHAIDAFDGEAWADCFAPDGAFESDLQGRFEGRAALIGFSDAGRQWAAEMEMQPRHWTNHWVIEGDGAEATATSYAMVVDTAHEGRLIAAGVYRDRLRKLDDRWRFLERIWTTDGPKDAEALAGLAAAFNAQ